MSNSIKKVQEYHIVSLESISANLNKMKEIANILIKSNLAPPSYDTPEKVVVGLIQAKELGIPPLTALRGIDIIQGVAAIKPQLMLALIKRCPFYESMEIKDDGERCFVTMKRKGEEPHTESFGVDDAKLMRTSEKGREISLSEKFNWRTMPRVMRRWRAISACARIVFPDILAGLYLPEEINPNEVLDADFEVEGVVDEVKLIADYGTIYKGLQTAIKKNTVESIENWFKLYYDDVQGLSDKQKNILGRMFAEQAKKVGFEWEKPNAERHTQEQPENKDTAEIETRTSII